MNSLIENIKTNVEKFVNTTSQQKYLKLLKYLDESYYNKNKSLLSDQLYDYIKEWYETKYGEITDIGAEVVKSVKLPYFLNSRKKVKSTKDLDNWTKTYRGSYQVSLKLNGMTGLIVKENNIVKLYTRGDGFYGEDKTYILNYINIDLRHIKNGDAIRGELIMSKENYNLLGGQFQTTLGAICGIINRKKIIEQLLNLIDFVAYNVLSNKETISKQFEYIEKNKINTPLYFNYNKIDNNILSELFEKYRNDYKYEIDGIIITDDSMYHPLIEEKYPKYSIAFKQVMTDQQAETIVLDVIWTIQKDAYITPKIRIQPVEILGSIIEFVTAHNAKTIQENIIGIGSKMIIIKSGDIIPKIHKILSPSENGEPLMPIIECEWDKTNTNLIAININETEQDKINIKQLSYTFDKLDVANFSEATITKLYNDGFNTFWKILKADSNELIKIKGLNIKNVTKIYNNIEESLHKIQLYELMNASLCFGRTIGSKRLKLILDNFNNIIDIYTEHGIDYIYDLILNIKGIEDITATKICDGFEGFIEWLEKLVKIKPYINIKYGKEKIKAIDNKYKDKKICFSGFRDKELEEKLINMGSIIVSGVSSKTNILIVKDINESSSKINKAKELGIEIIEYSNIFI